VEKRKQLLSHPGSLFSAFLFRFKFLFFMPYHVSYYLLHKYFQEETENFAIP